jgi:hypothetical protein
MQKSFTKLKLLSVLLVFIDFIILSYTGVPEILGGERTNSFNKTADEIHDHGLID